MDEPFSAILAERIQVDLLSGQAGAAMAVFFASALGLSDIDPIGGLVADAVIATGVDKTNIKRSVKNLKAQLSETGKSKKDRAFLRSKVKRLKRTLRHAAAAYLN